MYFEHANSLAADLKEIFSTRLEWSEVRTSIVENRVEVVGKSPLFQPPDDSYWLVLKFVPSASGGVDCQEILGRVRHVLTMEEYVRLKGLFQSEVHNEIK